MEQFRFGVIRFPEEKPFILFTEYAHAQDFAHTNRNNGILNIVELADDKWVLYIPFFNREV